MDRRRQQPAGGMTGAPGDPHQLAVAMGAAIRTRRQALGLTMTALARRADLSQPFLSKVERGVGQLSVPAIERLARALGTSAVGLLAGIEGPATFDLVRRGERNQFEAFEHGAGVGFGVTRRAGQLGVVEFEGGPADFPATSFVHRNDSVCLVQNGRYEFDIEGNLFELAQGDSVSASGAVEMRYRVLERPARFLLIFVSEDVQVVHPGL